MKDLPQAYDSSLKQWIFHQTPAILSLLLPGATYEQTLTIEQIHPTVRMDNVFKIRYHEEEHILHLEFEAKHDKDLPSRLLAYNAGLYRDHQLPVITMVIYPFKVTMAVSPLCIKSGKEDEILTFRFKTLPLFDQDAETFVREHHTAMYPLLPAMQNVHAELIDQVMQELVELYQDDEVTLAQQLIWMELLLERTDTILSPEKEKVEEKFSMFEQLWEESPRVKKMRETIRKEMQEQVREEMQEQCRTQWTQEGLQRGRQEALQSLLVNLTQAKYPDLAERARALAGHFDNPDTLQMLIQQVMTAPDASTARWLLESGTGK